MAGRSQPPFRAQATPILPPSIVHLAPAGIQFLLVAVRNNASQRRRRDYTLAIRTYLLYDRLRGTFGVCTYINIFIFTYMHVSCLPCTLTYSAVSFDDEHDPTDSSLNKTTNSRKSSVSRSSHGSLIQP
jgi:hypothetical protein